MHIHIYNGTESSLGEYFKQVSYSVSECLYQQISKIKHTVVIIEI